MKRPQLVSAGSLKRMLQTADEAYVRGDFQQSIEIFERASRLDPANWMLLMQLGSVHGRNFDYAAAERCFDRAVRLAPDKREALSTAGRQSLGFIDPKLSENYFRRATEQPNPQPIHMVRLAELCERYHRFEEASQLID